MSKKVFRLHNNGAVMGGWDNSSQYNSQIIQNIQDPNGAAPAREITSIPSPFARMDLVKEAFADVCDNGLNGTTIYHKMVSHALDIAQMFFDIDKFRNAGLLKLVKWDASNLNSLIGSGDPKHRLLGETLNLFMVADAEQFNFPDMNGLYMLQYVGPNAPSTLPIIGSTSPASLFYTSANDHSFLSGQILFGTHQALSENPADFLALKDRADEKFIIWMYTLRAAIPNFSNRFKAVDNYLNATYGQLPHNLQIEIRAIDNTSFATNFDPLEIAPGVPVEILNVPLRGNRPIDIGATSDFAINSDKAANRKPLVLPCEKFAYPWKYTVATWNQETVVPLLTDNKNPISDRLLPDDGSQYPYLTMTDFLEDALIQIDCAPNSKDFFDGNLKDKTGEPHSFLLPVKRKYFEYFTTDDLQRNMSMACDKAPGGGLQVKVTLRIPVKGGQITYNRNYITGGSMLNPKDGKIETKNFTAVLFPKTRFRAGTTPDYIVGTMAKAEGCSPSITCLTNAGQAIQPTLGPSDKNMDTAGKRIDSTSPAMPLASYNQNFDFIEMSIGNLTGIAVPRWSGVAGSTIYEFAVDFGTSNTHIEYRTAETLTSCPLDINAEFRQIGTLNADALSDPDYRIAINENCIPIELGGKGNIHFPMRTLLSYKRSTNWSTPTAPYITGNMPFYNNDIATAPYNTLKSDLKWANDSDITAMIKCYLGSLMHIMRNKVVMEGGDLAKTKICWFYPTSMPAARVASISNIWANLYQEYIGGDTANNLKTMPESIAPYKYYQHTFGAGVDVLTVDIGGGTSDAYIVDSTGSPAFITSFRFAANALIGDGFVTAGLPTNGFVAKYRPLIDQILNANGCGLAASILEQVAQSGVSSDYISSLFGLKDNMDVINAKCQDQVDFMSMLQQSDGAKTIVLVFYTAIIYHLATFIKAKREGGANIQEPAVLAFSGNGSKLLQILGINTPIGKQTLASYTKAIFEKVNGREYPHRSFDIVIDPDRPKEATCKGGLLTSIVPSFSEIKSMTDTLLGTSPREFINDRKYAELSDKDWQGLQSTISDFTRVFFELANEQDIQNNFGTIGKTILSGYRPLFEKDVKLRTSNALTFMGLLGSPDPIEDTLFFYPITELLHKLAQEMQKNGLL